MFGDRVARAVEARASQLVLGLDPDPDCLWPGAVERRAVASRTSNEPGECAARAAAAHCRLVMDAVGEQCVAVKLQLACFERLGAPGWRALSEVATAAREQGLLVIADGKRGDIDVSAAAYAQAFFGEVSTPYGPVPGLGADALTVNPLLGRDALGPLLEEARGRGCGLFVLVRTTNPGAADVQELPVISGGTVSERLAMMVSELGQPGLGSAGFSDVGAVVGATAPHRLAALRQLMPRAIFLIPGVGAQGGSVDALRDVFGPGRAAGLVTVSRAIVGAHEIRGGDPAQAARREAARLREATWSLVG